jgi:hypothetical protein
VWQLTRRSRRSAIGGRATARAIDGHAVANPVIKDKNSRRSIAFRFSYNHLNTLSPASPEIP